MLAQGAYGCIFKPSLLCEGEQVAPENTISKLLTDESNELRMKAILEQLDPLQQHFIYPIHSCKPSRRYNKSLRFPTNAIQKCDLDIADEDARLLRYNYGGESLYTLVVQPKDYSRFFIGLTSLLEGLALLHTNPIEPIYHLDIKSDNIVCDASMKCRYIDFGISDTREHSVVNDFKSTIYPFEVQFVNGYTFEGKPFSETVYDVEHVFLENFRKDSNYFPASMVIPLAPHAFLEKYELASSLHDFEKALEPLVQGDFMVSFLFAATDVFSLGKVLSRLYGRHMGQFLDYSYDHSEGHLFFLDAQGVRKQFVKGRYEKGLYDELTDEGQKQWFLDVYKSISTPFYKLILRMLHLNPFKRITAAKAVEAYKKIIPHMERLLVEESIVKYMGFMAPHLPYGQKPVSFPAAAQPLERRSRAYSVKAKNREKLNKRRRSIGRNNVVVDKYHWKKYGQN